MTSGAGRVPSTDGATEGFTGHRDLLFTVAYEMLGSVAEAEDVLQDSWLRWAEVDPREVRDARAYLVRLVTRQSLNRLRSLKRRRESYVGSWLPEPVATTADVAEDVELAESVSLAMLVVLETLTPLERAVFVLREVFGFEYDEIAAATDRTSTAVRQVASRARRHVEARRPRMSAEDHDEVASRFFVAATTGDVQGLMDVLAPDVVLLSDGGGVVKAALRPVHGADKVVRFVLGTVAKVPDLETAVLTVNGTTAALGIVDGRPDTVVGVSVRDGRVTQIFLVRNPAKLDGIAAARTLRRG